MVEANHIWGIAYKFKIVIVVVDHKFHIYDIVDEFKII
jgi:hypothetical protein